MSTMPDPMLTLDDLEKCGYRDGDMLPLSKERAMELYERDLTVYAVVDGGSAEMLFDREEFDTQPPGPCMLFPAKNGRKARSLMRGCRTA